MLHLCLYKDQSILDIRHFRGIYLSPSHLGDRYEHSGGRLSLQLQAKAMSIAMSSTRQIICCTRSVRKVSDLFFLFEHLMDYNLARLHEPTLNLSAHA